MTVAPNKASSESNSNNLKKDDFPKTAPAAYPVFFRSYSRKTLSGKRENWSEVGERNLSGLKELGKLSEEELILMKEMQSNQKAQPSGRWLWIGGTPWINKNQNFSGAYNCTSTNLIDWEAFALMMDLAMMGCGTGAIIEPHFINKLPTVLNKINIKSVSEVGITPKDQREEKSSLEIKGKDLHIKVGDSRRGWVDSYKYLLEASSNENLEREIDVFINLEDIRPAGESLKGFGGMANPIKLKDLYSRVALLLGKAIGRKLSTVECCLLIDEAAVTIVAGNIRRSAGMRQFASDDKEAASAKENLWSQDANGNWRIDPEKDALRMANHTRVYHTKPTYQTVLDAVTKQFHSGEGAIQFAPEAIARSNADILKDNELKKEFIEIYSEQGKDEARNWINSSYGPFSEEELDHRMSRYGLNPCGEILGNDFHCNLAEVHLNQIDPGNFEDQKKAFKAAALSVACLLNHEFEVERYRKSREYDPIVGVSFTGLFDFCVHAFGTPWLKWWESGRPNSKEGKAFKEKEAKFLDSWRKIVKETVWEYCDKHNLRRPNRCTTVQPAGTKSLLTGAAPGWHPPKAQRFIRRITFRKNDPIALACMDYGYSVVPSQSDKDENGCLLDNPFDPRCTEWLVEIPTEVSWANIDGADQIDINNFSALAQFDFYMQVQKFYTEHNTSATVEFRENEIEDLAKAIHNAIENNEGYISAALLARFSANATFPRLPFEPISKEEYLALQNKVIERKVNNDFFDALNKYDVGELSEAGPAGCDSDKCLLPLAKPKD
ncbi:ribonucleoside-triphosphate reductase, adenosylcobalamin-dependent [Prochlorococcus marinus XMU1406]|uniref:ribonucleoside-triphosphate reductase, adenosylcobalamin-dependent n=1 Tax=Prochlorococcus marinus TaxID=1219 RepID=UPI001AD9A25E|nr:ribonucleoside-triphosphate reductase, adenosylcobalamin-dependent [Prochlorococcus marinus XMU1406]MCR8543794.1 ribonucleoside-triphosphate reductase, adenosylcobalamin-dependent [Prochlorococcus marinus XMU1427]